MCPQRLLQINLAPGSAAMPLSEALRRPGRASQAPRRIGMAKGE